MLIGNGQKGNELTQTKVKVTVCLRPKKYVMTHLIGSLLIALGVL